MIKKIKILGIFILFGFPLTVFAKPSASISAPSTVEVGSSVTATVTLRNTAAWNIEIKSSGQTSGCSETFADATVTGKNTTKTLSVKCKATSTGTIGFTVVGDITDEDGETTDVSVSKRVSINPAREKSKDANLASLSVDGYELTPAFDKDILEYSLTIPATENSIKINAKVNESHANLKGIGEYEVSEGLNPFEIEVTAETGATKTYKINVNVEDTNPIEVKIGNLSYTLIKNAKNLTKPEFYEETTIEINGISIPAFKSETTQFTLIGLKDSVGAIHLAIYNAENNEYKLYNEMNASHLTLYLVDFPEILKGYSKGTVTINDIEVPVYKYNDDSRFVICYGMDITTGKYDYYTYDTKEGTFQVWNQDEVNDLQKELKTCTYICIALGIGFSCALILSICLLLKKRHLHTKEKKRMTEFNKETRK